MLLPLARALEQQGDAAAAADYYARARGRQEWSREGTLGLVRVYLKQGRYDQAEELACDWLGTRPDDAEARALLRQALDAAGKAYARPGCPAFQPPPEPKPQPKPKPAVKPQPKPAPPPPPPPQQCDPFCN